MATPLTDEQFARLFTEFEHTAFRLELQPVYLEPTERETFERFLAGHPQEPTEVPELRGWFELIRELTAHGKRIERVRVQSDPPTDYQRWERWIGGWNIDAGETLRYMTPAKAVEVGLLPAVGNVDWWLFDSCRLVQMHFDDEGHRIKSVVTTDAELVVRACAWRDLAVHYSTPDQPGSAAA